jgi:hypothetical protein
MSLLGCALSQTERLGKQCGILCLLSDPEAVFTIYVYI